MIHYLHKSSGYTSVGPLNKRHCVLVDSEVGLYCHVCCYVLDRQRIVHSCIIACPAVEVIVGVGYRIHWCTIAAMIHYLHESSGNTSVGSLDERYCVLRCGHNVAGYFHIVNVPAGVGICPDRNLITPPYVNSGLIVGNRINVIIHEPPGVVGHVAGVAISPNCCPCACVIGYLYSCGDIGLVIRIEPAIEL